MSLGSHDIIDSCIVDFRAYCLQTSRLHCVLQLMLNINVVTVR